jgi:hypothetical protein
MTTSSTLENGRPRSSKLSRRLAALVALAAVSSLALTACSGPGSDTTELVVFVVSEDPVFLEDATQGTTIGDIRSRSYESYATLENALAGEEPLSTSWTTMATVVDEDLEKQTDMRSLTGHATFNDGSSLTWLGSGEIALGKVPVVGPGHTYVVVGGTGKYFGARGTMSWELIDVENQIYRDVFTLILEKS